MSVCLIPVVYEKWGNILVSSLAYIRVLFSKTPVAANLSFEDFLFSLFSHA